MTIYLKMAWRNIWRNRRRTMITMSSVIMAVLLSTLMGSMQQGQYDQMIDNTVGTFVGHMQIQDTSYKDEPTLDHSFEPEPGHIGRLTAHPQILAVVPRLDAFALAAGEQRTRATLVLGIDTEAEKFLSRPHERMLSGTYFESNSDTGAVLATGLADFLQLSVGDTLVLIGQGFRGMSAAAAFPVTGIMRFSIPDLNNALVYLPLETARTYFAAPGRLTSMAILTHHPAGIPDLAASLRPELPGHLRVLDWQTLMPEIVQAIQADYGGNIILQLVLYMVVGFGILGTVLMMTAERTYEFGVMIAIGTSRARMAAILILEMLFITVLGTLSGIVISLPVIYYFHFNPIRFYGEAAESIMEWGMEPLLQFSTAPYIFILQAAIVLFITLVISVYPVWHMKNLQPVNAMRS